MPFGPGTRLGPYEILSAIGAGGMGEVYRARDTKLDRDVAIKVLPEAFAADAERIARFQREAKTLVSLNQRNRRVFVEGPRVIEPAAAPSVLVSFVYLKAFVADRPRWRIRSWCMDSGAFTARSSGEPVDLDAYIDCCQQQIATDKSLDFVIALDVIGDWRAGRSIRSEGPVMPGTYTSLYQYVENRYANTVVLTFAHIEVHPDKLSAATKPRYQARARGRRAAVKTASEFS